MPEPPAPPLCALGLRVGGAGTAPAPHAAWRVGERTACAAARELAARTAAAGDEAIEWMPCGVAEHGRGRLPTALRGGVVCSVGKMSPADSIDLCRFGALSSIRSVSLSIAQVTLGRVLAPAVVGR